MFASFFTPAVSAVRNFTDPSFSSSCSSHTCSTVSKPVLRLLGLADANPSITGNDALSAPSARTGMGTFPDDLDHPGSLKRSSSRRPLKILTLPKGVPAPPVLTPPTSPLDSPITSNLESGSEILYFDDGGALIYHMPEPSTVSTQCVTRCLAFAPLTPIMECSEPSELLPAFTSFTTQGDLSELQGSLSTMSFGESVSHFDLVLPLPSSAEHISYFAHLDSIDSGLNDDGPVPPVEIKAPSPSRSYIDSISFRHLLTSDGKDIEEENSTLDIDTVPSLEHCLPSGDSSAYGPITPIGLCTNGVDPAIASDSGSYFGTNVSAFKSYQPKKPSPFSSLLYVGQPPTPPSESVFAPFGPDEDTLPPLHSESAHVGVDIMNELLAGEDEDHPALGNFISPFDQLKHDILHDRFTTVEKETPRVRGLALFIDTKAKSDFVDIVPKKKTSPSVDMLALSKRVVSWIDGILDAAGDGDDQIVDDASTSDDDACDGAVYNAEFSDSDSDSDADEDDEDFPPFILEHGGVKYTITGEVGQGTYGQVVFARTSLGEEVAIKICCKARDGMAPGELRKIVLNERNILVRISQEDKPFLTQALACFQDEANVYFVLVSFLNHSCSLAHRRYLYTAHVPTEPGSNLN